MPLDLLGESSAVTQTETTPQISHLRAGVLDRVIAFITLSYTPIENPAEKFRDPDTLSIFDIEDVKAEFERLKKENGGKVDYILEGNQRITEEELRNVEGRFQKMRYEYALSLLTGYKGNAGQYSKYAEQHLLESSRIHEEIFGEPLLSHKDNALLQEMKNKNLNTH